MAGRLPELLARLEREWARQRAPILDRLAPGLSDAEIDERTAGLPFELPAELRCWWGWHDGAPARRGEVRYHETIGVAYYAFLPLAAAVEAYRKNREIHPEPPAPYDSPEVYWRAGWLPFLTADASRVYADCAAATPDGAVPVGVVHEDWDDFDRVRAASLADAVEVWVRALEAGAYRWDPVTAYWQWDPAACPADLRLHGLL